MLSPRWERCAYSHVLCGLSGPCGLEHRDDQTSLIAALVVVLFDDVPVRFAFRMNGEGCVGWLVNSLYFIVYKI